MKLFLFPSALKFCEFHECSYCIFLFFIFQAFLKRKENVPLFLAYVCREDVFSLKAYFGGVMGFHLLRNFYFVLLFKNQRKDVREVGIKLTSCHIDISLNGPSTETAWLGPIATSDQA